MNSPFTDPLPDMEVIEDEHQSFSTRPQSAPANARYEFSDTDDDRQPLSPHVEDSYASSSSSFSSVVSSDIEAQRAPEMVERPSRFMLPRWSRPAIPSFLSMGRGVPRPTSSHYSGDMEHDYGYESPKTPAFPALGVQNYPSSQQHMPMFQQAWTQPYNGSPLRRGTVIDDGAGFLGPADGLAEPMPAMSAPHSHRTRGQGSRRAGGSDRSRRGENGRRHRRHRSDRGGSKRSGRTRRPPPKNFLFCFPWIKSRTTRTMILKCFVSGLFLTLLLTVYLALSISGNINTTEFTIPFILVIVFVTIFFCHSLIRLCMRCIQAGKKSKKEKEEEAERDGRAVLPHIMGPGGYAVPTQPIRVVLARDEEAAGLESAASKVTPPAYGLWRESVRVDPNRLFWARNEAATTLVGDESVSFEPKFEPMSLRGGGDDGSGMTDHERPVLRRPPSYASDDGVSYVVEAQPRSIAPTTDVPISQHPAEIRTPQTPARWL